MKKLILLILADSGTTPAVINNDEMLIGIYSFENDVFCLEMGEDIPFDEFEEEKQNTILKELQAGNFNLDPTF